MAANVATAATIEMGMMDTNGRSSESHPSSLEDGRVVTDEGEANGICAQKDDMSPIYEKMNQADMLVIASPVYFYGISAQLKAVIDRFHNPIRDSFNIKKMALLLVGAASLPELFDAILTEYNLCLNFFNIEDAGKVLVRGVKDKGDIKGTRFLDDAYQLGTSI